jgi:hypothetical protein
VAQFSVYALRPDFPRRLEYRDGACFLELVPGPLAEAWTFRARKVPATTVCAITSSPYGRLALETVLRQGFVVQQGTAAARLLDRLVRERCATVRPANRRDLA